MRIVDVDEATRPLFCLCLEDWSDDVKEAGDRRRLWVDRFAPRGLRARLALDETGTPGGMIQYLPIEESTGLLVQAARLFVDGKQVVTGPPPPPERLRKVIGKRVARL